MRSIILKNNWLTNTSVRTVEGSLLLLRTKVTSTLTLKQTSNVRNYAKGTVLPNIRRKEIAHQKPIPPTMEKSSDDLNEFGMSISKWKIKSVVENNAQDVKEVINKAPTISQNRRRRRLNSETTGSDFSTYDTESHQKLSDPYYFYNNPRRIPEQDESLARLNVDSTHVATTIDLSAALTKVFNPSSRHPSIRYIFGKEKVTIELPPKMKIKRQDITLSGDDEMDESTMERTATNDSNSQIILPRFVVIFRYGSIVLFNISKNEVQLIVDEIKKYSTELIPPGYEKREHFEIAVDPNMISTAHVNSNFATVKELDVNSVVVISQIMAQTVAFDSYNDTADELLAQFSSINAKVKKTGHFTAMERTTLLRVVAQNNQLIIDMLAKLGVKDRSGTAWNLSQYERVYEEMKNEFQIDSRFEDIEFKLNLIQQNTKFFLGALDTENSNALEWIIIVLISFECILMILEMSGVGPTLFRSMKMFYVENITGENPPP